MTTITEDYVSFEIAKLLKEKGFQAKCTACYHSDPSNTFELVSGRINYCNPRFNKCKMIPPYNAPTLQMAMKWLREIHKVHIIAEPCLGEGFDNTLCFNRWFWTIFVESGEYKPIRKIDEFPTYETACENAIKHCLKNLI